VRGQNDEDVRKQVFTVCGLNAVRAIAANDLESVERLFFDENHSHLFAAACRHLAKVRKIYRAVTSSELAKIAGTEHHQGAAIVIRKAKPIELTSAAVLGVPVVLHDVKNPHNIGAILRTAAFFGAESVIASAATYDAAMTSSAWRVAEGGLTYVKLIRYREPAEFFAWLKKSGRVAAAAVPPGASSSMPLNGIVKEKSAAICLGNEEDGLPAAFQRQCRLRFSIAGSGNIESLNVSVTAALCFSALHAVREHSTAP